MATGLPDHTQGKNEGVPRSCILDNLKMGWPILARGREFAKALREHQTLDFSGFARVIIAIDYHSAQARVARGGLETHRHSVQELSHHQFLLYSDHAIVGPGH